jgi:hypothetical protein
VVRVSVVETRMEERGVAENAGGQRPPAPQTFRP